MFPRATRRNSIPDCLAVTPVTLRHPLRGTSDSVDHRPTPCHIARTNNATAQNPSRFGVKYRDEPTAARASAALKNGQTPPTPSTRTRAPVACRAPCTLFNNHRHAASMARTGS